MDPVQQVTLNKSELSKFGCIRIGIQEECNVQTTRSHIRIGTQAECNAQTTRRHIRIGTQEDCNVQTTRSQS